MIIAIDGPAGAGKTTVARALARRLGLTHIDTGAMYRAVALKCLRNGVALADVDGVERMARSAEIAFEWSGYGNDAPQRVFLDGEDVTEAIRTPEVSALSSPVSAIPGVRQELVRQQRAMAAAGNVVMEGRDVGTVVLPNADVKVFLTASSEERARRRWRELKQRSIPVELEAVLREIQERDERDSTRANSPLRPAEDAVVIDTDALTADEVTEQIIQLANSRK